MTLLENLLNVSFAIKVMLPTGLIKVGIMTETEKIGTDCAANATLDMIGIMALLERRRLLSLRNFIS